MHPPYERLSVLSQTAEKWINKISTLETLPKMSRHNSIWNTKCVFLHRLLGSSQLSSMHSSHSINLIYILTQFAWILFSLCVFVCVEIFIDISIPVTDILFMMVFRFRQNTFSIQPKIAYTSLPLFGLVWIDQKLTWKPENDTHWIHNAK